MEKLDKRLVEFIIMHHSNRVFDCPVFIKMRHKFLRGWSDTGYHFIIGNGVLSKNGKIYNGRSVDFVGAHAYGYNPKSIGVCLIGNFDKVKPTFKQYRSLISLLKILKSDYNIQTKNIISHNETKNCLKTCPGKFFPIKRVRKLLGMPIE